MSYELREHTADVAVAAEASSLGGVFAAVADGMAAAQCADLPDAGGERTSLAVRAEAREALLFDYLDELIYERDVRQVLPADNRASVTGPTAEGAADSAWTLEGSYRGVPLETVAARDLKAVTYSDMRIAETSEGWEAYVVFDV